MPPNAWQVPPTESIGSQPGFQQPGYQQPSYPPPGYQQPGYPPPGYPPPGYQQPGFAQPGFSQPGYPPVPPVPPPPRKRRRPPLWALIVSGVVVIGLIVGLVIWAPWSPPPQAPTALRVSSPTATSALVSWTAPKAGATPDQYDIFRDGKEQGIVPATQTSWTDTGLAPGSKHSYTVVTRGNGKTSASTAKVAVTTITPAPVGLTETAKTYTTATLHWSPPPNAPAPDLYTIYDTSTGKDELARIQGSDTSYTVTQLVAGDNYSFAVMASWGSAVSTLAPVEAPPLSPPLTGTVPLNLKVTKILSGSTGLTVGETWSDSWKFTASCPSTSCTLTDKGSLITNVAPFTVKLTPSKGGYQGKATHVQFSHCAGVNSFVTLTLQIFPNTGGVTNGAWNSWHGTMTLDYAGQTVGSSFCDPGSWALNLTGTGS